MIFLVIWIAFFLLYLSNPSLFAWNATGFHTLMVAVVFFAIVTVWGIFHQH